LFLRSKKRRRDGGEGSYGKQTLSVLSFPDYVKDIKVVAVSYQSSISYLFGLQRFGIKFGLENITHLLSRLGDPHHHLKSVHIGGTNGKGSTGAFIASILKRQGYRVGLYTSPHLVSFTERIQTNEKRISRRRVAELTELIRREAEQLDSITFFEFATAMALLHFLEEKVDLAVLEVGMGGRLDATNVVNPLVSVITNVSMEHKVYLGSTLLQIAREKAGIIKEDGRLITAVRQPGVRALFESECARRRCALYRVGRDFRGVHTAPRSFDYQGLSVRVKDIGIGLAGRHQIVNATTAIGAVEVLAEQGLSASPGAIRDGIAGTHWPGRLEVVNEHPTVLLDGAHNPRAAGALREALLREFKGRKILLVLGIMEDKDIGAMMRALVPLAKRLVLTRPKMDRAASPELLCMKARKLTGVPMEIIEDVREAVKRSLSLAKSTDLICVTGSLFTVGEARTYFKTV
jgi:dihydrofolate synthase/folylpolyglutamate synthase